MKEELQSKLVEILTSMQTAAGKAQDFALEQLPDIAQSYVAYGRFSATASAVCWVLAVVALLSLAVWLWRNPWYSTYSWDEGKNVRSTESWMAMTLSAIFGAAACIGAATAIVHGSLVWFAPKVWLLKEIASFLK